MQPTDGISALFGNSPVENAVTVAEKTTLDLANKSIEGNDGSFGPQYGSSFDLTLLFEHSILTFVPIGLLILACPLYILVRRRRPVEAERDGLFWSKIGAALLLFLIQLAQLVLWTSTVKGMPKLEWAIAASASSCFGAFCVALMLSSEHRHSIQPSTFLSVYFFFSVITDGIRAGTYISRNVQLEVIGGLQVAVTVLSFALLILEEIPKTSSVKSSHHARSPGKEAVSGFWSRTLFIWLNDVFLLGFRASIKVKDLSNLGPEFSTERLVEGFDRIWAKTDKTKDHSLLWALCRQHGGSFLLAMPPRIGFAIASFSQPFIIYHAVGMVNRKNVSTAEKQAMIVATAAVYAGIAIFRALHTHFVNRADTLVRGTLLGRIYGKTLTLPAKKASDGASITHITTDLDTVSSGVQRCNDLWISFFEIGFAMFFLYIYVEYSCFLLFIPACWSTLSGWYIGPKQGDARKAWTKRIEERVSQTTSILAQARSIKATGLSKTLTQYILGLRSKEIKSSQRYRWLETLLLSMSFLCESFAPVIVVAGAVFLTKIPIPLEADRIFATVALLRLAAVPIEMILISYSRIRDTISCIDRIGSYIIEKEQQDHRKQTAHVSTDNARKSSANTNDVFSFIETVNAAVSFPDAEELAVEHATVSVPHGKLTIATGQTGSGKTTFLKSIIGEADIVSGHVFVEDIPIAYCDQKPWLCNNTMKENIVGPYLDQVDETWYGDVLTYCCLNEDIRQLVDGDQTLIGTDGSKLSGGQRQRVALARALHSRSPVMIFDDIFSALDRVTARKIFFNLFSRNGILRRLNTTVILATHSVEFLSAADAVLHFDGEKKVALKAGQAQLPDYDIDPVATQGGLHANTKDEPTAKKAPISDVAERNEQHLRDMHHKGDWNLWMFFFKSAPAWMFSIFILFSMIQGVAESATTIFMRIWIDRYANDRWFFAAYATAGLAPIFGYLGMAIIFYHGIVPYYANDMHAKLVTAMLGANLVFLTSTDHAILINRISQDMTIITQRFAVVFFQIPYLVAVVFTDIAIIVAASYYTIILIPFICAIFYVVQLIYLRTSRQIRMLDLESKTPLYKQLSEMGSGVEHIRAFHWEKEFLQQSYDMIDESQKPFYYMSCIQRWLGLVLDLINLVTALVLICFALYWNNTTSESGIGLGFLGLLNLGNNFAHFMELFAQMESSLAAVARLRFFVNDTPQEEDDIDAEQLDAAWPPNGKIKFRNVSAAYTEGDGQQDVLKHVSFDIEPQQTAGFVGRTGSGKSSIFLTLLGFLPYRGTIKIDGTEVSKIPRQVLRERLTAIPQDGLILPGTIRQNLMPWLLNEADPPSADQISAPVVFQVLHDTFMAEKVESVGGLDTDMDKLGLSAGEKQLFSMARSILVNQRNGGKIILMDEATSNLDVETDKKLQHSIRKAFENFTICTIAHRTETVEKADMVYEIRGGRLASQTRWS